MEISKSLREDIVKIQLELVTAIQNHQVLVLRQQVNPSESVKTQIEEVQRHIICLGESQKILVSRLNNELQPQSIRVNNKHKDPRPHSKQTEDRINSKLKSQDLSRSLLINNVKKQSGESEVSERKSLLKDRQPSVDSSSEENRTPCLSPVNGNSDNEPRSLKRPLIEANCHQNKRIKSTLQVAPRPSSPVPARNKLDQGTSSSEDSLDSLLSQQPDSESKIDFALSLGLITKEVYNRIVKKKSERRRRRVSNQHHLYNDLWDLTVLQKRNRLKEHDGEDGDDVSQDYGSPQSDTDSLCFVCRKPGELRECRVCQTGCHQSCVSNNICPACTYQATSSTTSPVIAEKKKELEQLRMNNKELHKSVAKLRERAKVLSASLVMQTATVNQLAAKEEKLHESIKKLKDFITCIQRGPKPST